MIVSRWLASRNPVADRYDEDQAYWTELREPVGEVARISRSSDHVDVSAVRLLLEAVATHCGRVELCVIAEELGVPVCRHTDELIDRIHTRIGEDLAQLVSPASPLGLDAWNEIVSSPECDLRISPRKSFPRLRRQIEKTLSYALPDDAAAPVQVWTTDDRQPRESGRRGQTRTTRPADAPLQSIVAVRKYLRHELVADLERHRRILHGEQLNEATYCAIVMGVIEARLHNGYGVHVDTSIPGTSLRPDLIIFKNRATGVIAIELKPNAQTKGLLTDLKKLEGYVRRGQVNFGLLVYFSSTNNAEEALRQQLARSKHARKLAVRRVGIQRLRVHWTD